MHIEELTCSRSLFLHAYYYGSWPLRALRNRAAAAAGRAPVPILFYHRIADDCANPWTVSNRDFERQIIWLRRHFEIISLGETQRRISGHVPSSRRPAVSITFDDGHADNCPEAIPLVVKHGVPCTYFVAVDHIVSGRPFAADGCTPNTVEQIRAMAASGIEIGAHTASHADLGSIRDYRTLHREIVDSSRRLEDLIGRRVRYFAFPFGQYVNMSSAAFQIARDAGFEAACSAYGGYNFPGDDPFHLQRIHVDAGMIRLKNRVTIDPRMARTPRFCWTPMPHSDSVPDTEPVG